MAFFASAIDTLKILVIALGAGLGAWGVINLLEGYGNDNSGADLTPEETERLAAYRRKKAGQQRARREGKKCDQPKRKVS